MKVKETVGAIGFFALVGAKTAGLAVVAVIQVAAAGVELLVVAPFAEGRKKSLAPRGERVDVRLPKTA